MQAFPFGTQLLQVPAPVLSVMPAPGPAQQGSVVVLHPPPSGTHCDPGSVGRALPGVEIVAVDDQGRRLGPGEVGTLHCRMDGAIQPFEGDTDIFITPGYRFRVVDRLVTNFHLPRSTLLMLVSAFAGLDDIRAAYAHAVAERYRFFSYGDAMLLEKSQ